MNSRSPWITATAGVLLFGCFSIASQAAGTPQPRPLEVVLGEISAEDGAAADWQVWDIDRHGFKKKVRFERRDGQATTTMKYKGLPVSWGSPLELVVDRKKYAKNKHRVKYRFVHPTSGQALVLWARSTIHSVRTIPIRDADSAPALDLLDAESREEIGRLQYHWDSPRIFDGEIQGRSVVIERLGEKPAFEKGWTGYFLAPYPILGEYAVRIDGSVEAVFIQQPQRGFRSPFELALRQGADGATDEDAMTAFIVFDLMKTFVESAD